MAEGIEYDCTICNDKEITLQYVDDDWKAVPCSCKKQKKLKRLIKASGLTDLLKEKTFRTFKIDPNQEKMYKVAVEFVTNYPDIKKERCNGLAFTGTVGTGKTHLLAAIANNLLLKEISVCFVNTPSFISELRRSQFTEGLFDQQMDAVKNAEVVIFDDLAKEKITDWVQTQYYEIINHRYINHLPTLFSTNCDMDELNDKLGDATASRLYAMTKTRLIHIDGRDYRINE